ncbi:DUF2019 domain-containing protein [Aurantimonas sp. C2-6-R+9]|uniref:DUF2019 domain-containing protein n=1 Tax=unclassified Aurantimonas TaxID=2638230 RepID=UPI002E187A0A|nr:MULTISPECIES: DUF2019 domain-containing protein [unclassified Aurantimonas]MEC5289033.1 DUF2019 domain-containing protein [Aurantimonas sp. C2-3-R2]MEC5379392.1 DUF2019 domain-containing protein [Aurantimonas sp. C2-6-R+9]MEC5410145.1 DUF2019 domain-containing protein [Aurantimonas sp. C2-4-R8]
MTGSTQAAKRDYRSFSIEQLVAAFVAVSLEQSEALHDRKIARYNRLYRDYAAIEEELRSRESDQRRALRPLFDHINAQVRMNAAFSTLAVLPEEAKEALRLIHLRREYPQAADAIGMLEDIEKGRFIPDVGRVDLQGQR